MISPARQTLGAVALAGLFVLAGCVHGPLPGPTPARPGPALPGAIAYPEPGPPIARPAKDVFYRQPIRARLANLLPGTVLRYRPINARAYRISHVQARAWQIVYRSRNARGEPVADVATLLWPARPRHALLAYQVAYDALNPICAPSQEILRGTMIEQWFVTRALRRGWPVVLSDHEGPNMAYLAGRNAGYAVLDAVRAALAFLPAFWPASLPSYQKASSTPVALWGYSGGAYASLWAAQMAARAAPELSIVGVAAGGPPADLLATARHVDGGAFAGVYFQAMLGLARARPDIDLDTLLNDRGQDMQRTLASSCLGQELAGVRDPLLSGLSFARMRDYTTVNDLLSVPAVRRVAVANRLGRRALAAPLYYYQGWFDPFTTRAQARALAYRYCARDTPVDFRWALGEHLLSAITQADNALDFLDARLDHRPVDDHCADILARWSDLPEVR